MTLTRRSCSVSDSYAAGLDDATDVKQLCIAAFDRWVASVNADATDAQNNRAHPLAGPLLHCSYSLRCCHAWMDIKEWTVKAGLAPDRDKHLHAAAAADFLDPVCCAQLWYVKGS
jgi:hypothetical protein